MFTIHVGLDQPAEYDIKVQGRLADSLADWFLGDVHNTCEPGADGQTITCLSGSVADQAALHGLLAQIRDLGLTLLYVECVTARGKRNGDKKSSS